MTRHFAKLPKDKLDALLKDKDALAKTVERNISCRTKSLAKMSTAGKVKSIEGHELKLDVSAGIKVDGVPYCWRQWYQKRITVWFMCLDTVLMQEHEGKKEG